MDTKTNGWKANYIEEYTEILEAIKETEKRPNYVQATIEHAFALSLGIVIGASIVLAIVLAWHFLS